MTETLLDGFDLHLRRVADRPALHFLPTGNSDDVRTLTRRALNERADAIACLLARATRPGDRAILAVRPGLDFVAGLIGMMRAGLVVVPAFPPTSRRTAERMLAIARDCAPAVLLHDLPQETAFRPDGRTGAEVVATMRLVHVDDAPEGGDLARTPRALGDPALLQYTSGSTGEPKGVVLTGANLLSNCEAMAHRLGTDREHVGVSWLPPYHDMGLIGAIMLALHDGWPLVMMSPDHFVQRPVRWLRAITEWRATVSVTPNFGLDLCVRNIDDDELHGIDLRSIEQLFCGAEPVEETTLASFRDRFAAYGYRESSLVPCYGLAEATLFVAGKPTGAPVATERLDRAALEQGISRSGHGVAVVGCGTPPDGTEIRIVDPVTRRECPEGAVGEIWIRGPGVATGYHGRPALSSRVFRAALLFPAEPRRYLRSGDLGYTRNQMLFVTGRISDRLMIAGRTLYPQDIERSAARAHPSVIRSAAFATRVEAAERVVVAAELRGRRAACELVAIERMIAAAVATDHGVRPAEIVLAPPGAIPRTTSGKTRRAETRMLFLAGTLKRLLPLRP